MHVFVLVLSVTLGTNPLLLLPRKDIAVYKTKEQCEKAHKDIADPDWKCLDYTILDPQ